MNPDDLSAMRAGAFYEKPTLPAGPRARIAELLGRGKEPRP